MKYSRDDFSLCKPRLARGCHLRDKEDFGGVLIPEGLIKLNDSALQVIRLCDGQRTVSMILSAVQADHKELQARQIEADMERFILRLVERRVLVFL